MNFVVLPLSNEIPPTPTNKWNASYSYLQVKCLLLLLTNEWNIFTFLCDFLLLWLRSCPLGPTDRSLMITFILNMKIDNLQMWLKLPRHRIWGWIRGAQGSQRWICRRWRWSGRWRCPPRSHPAARSRCNCAHHRVWAINGFKEILMDSKQVIARWLAECVETLFLQKIWVQIFFYKISYCSRNLLNTCLWKGK